MWDRSILIVCRFESLFLVLYFIFTLTYFEVRDTKDYHASLYSELKSAYP